ncbi:MAG: sulfite exporter TauE/SafE family protein [Sediminibacterium sp. Gen4]|jgi:cytochrome c biogenesis protein CcdA|uniref:sulfite exporter TauE/SafE family protein n=1 Tax=unclassified Sediminibacterium TaxID=2635961 RepID=UPI0015BEE596|nr:MULTISPECIES: sulfite exporter TauE/SafE family protein [unclassified Sediminibacterium]NBO49367.1 urease accessory protein [Chitinophagia bacterium]MBW0162415.1 sulfite exporter TauE/SafE family protein [Sediminibacterium sp.]MBW0164623.1 sulfite exporter TauE/SafE family protein [Sediminibacterium sp.]MDZ4070762.1 sulfite exporter TauE/SafE family protein [Sediminibacterium sp.]NWK66057.1 sulfite exporter TauE/SafE family protein [Sediminibacterium sp. Gen4]
MNNIPIILTLYVGFIHAFETDHILAVSNIVTNRDKSIKALKDGLSWGLGHTSTILIMGTLVLLMKFNISDSVFSYFEAVVGVVLVSLGIHRIIQWYKRKYSMAATHTHEDGSVNNGSHLPAFLIGLFHGLAGSGALILLVMSDSTTVGNGLLYLLLFGLGSVTGMTFAAGTFSLPFNKKIIANVKLQIILVFISSTLCITYGTKVIIENIF